MTVGGGTWFYTAEVTLDKAMGVCLFIQFGLMTIVVATFEYMVSSPLGPHGCFFLFSSIMLLAFVWTFCGLKETNGLTDN